MFYIFLITLCCCSCHNEEVNARQLQAAGIKDSVQQMMGSIAKDISRQGPVAWLTYFEKTPDFFMASAGQLVFTNGDTAAVFIRNILVKQIQHIDLEWSNIRIDPLTPKFAGVGANWRENIIDATGSNTSQSGYFTALAEKTATGWRLRNAHWSAIQSK